MRTLRRNLAIALIVRGLNNSGYPMLARLALVRLGLWLLPVGPAWRCKACHGTGYAWDAALGTMGPCDCLLN